MIFLRSSSSNTIMWRKRKRGEIVCVADVHKLMYKLCPSVVLCRVLVLADSRAQTPSQNSKLIVLYTAQ